MCLCGYVAGHCHSSDRPYDVAGSGIRSGGRAGGAATELFQSPQRLPDRLLRIEVGEVGAAQIDIGCVVGQHEPDHDEQGVLRGDHGLEIAPTGGDPFEERLQVRTVGAGGGHRGDPKSWGCPAGSVPTSPARPTRCARGGPRPGGQVPRGGENPHVTSGFGDDHVSDQAVYPRS